MLNSLFKKKSIASGSHISEVQNCMACISIFFLS